MVLFVVTVFVITGIGMGNYFLAKRDLKYVRTPLVLLLFIDAILLIAKFVFPAVTLAYIFIAYLLYLMTIILTLIALIIVLVKLLRKKPEKAINGRKRIVLIVNCIVVFIIFSIPSLSLYEWFSLYEDDYYEATKALLEAYDNGKFNEEKFGGYDLSNAIEIKELSEKTDDNVMKQLLKLHRWTGVYRIYVNNGVVYYQYGVHFFEVEGIAIFRDLNNDEPEPEYISQYIQGPAFTYIKENVYYYDGGM